MRIQHLLLTKEDTEYKVYSKQKLINKKNKCKLNFYTLNREVIIDYCILNDNEFSIRLKNKLSRDTHIIYEVDLDYSHLTKNYKNTLHQSYKSRKDIENILDKIQKEYEDLNENLIYKFYSDLDCIKFLKDYTDDYFVDIFKNIKQGAIKCDFWRLIILYIYGGFYCDIDFLPYKSFKSLLDNETEFIGCVDASNRSMFNAFIYSKPRHSILMDSILRFLEINVKEIKWTIGGFKTCYDLLYSIKQEIRETDSQDKLPHILINGNYNNKKIKIIQEVLCGENVYEWYVLYNGEKYFKSRRDDYDYKTHKFINKDNNNLITISNI